LLYAKFGDLRADGACAADKQSFHFLFSPFAVGLCGLIISQLRWLDKAGVFSCFFKVK